MKSPLAHASNARAGVVRIAVINPALDLSPQDDFFIAGQQGYAADGR
jgi:hypothetical protein